MGHSPAPFDSTWAFVLREEPDGTTRMLSRERYEYLTWWAPLVVEPTSVVSFVMSRKMLHGIAERSDAQPAARAVQDREESPGRPGRTRSGARWPAGPSRGMLTDVADPVIIELAVNGATPRSVNRHVPRAPDEIAVALLDGAARGASVLHNHTDDPMFTADGVHDAAPYRQAWGPVLDAHPDALLYPTMAAGARGIPVRHRWAHVAELAAAGGLALVDPGSVNLGLTSAGAVPETASDEPYQNSYADVEYMFATCAELGAAPSISIFEPGFLRTALTWHRRGLVPPGALVKLYFGGSLEFGLPPTPTALDAYLELLAPSGLPWSVAVLGGDVVGCGLAEVAILRGGHVRVGLEDHAGPGEPSNADLLDAAVALVERLGRAPATFAEARTILGIPAR